MRIFRLNTSIFSTVSSKDSPASLYRMIDERFQRIPLGLEVGDYAIQDDENFDQKVFLEKVAAFRLNTSIFSTVSSKDSPASLYRMIRMATSERKL